MSVQEFRDIFKREIDSHLARLQRHSTASGSRPGSPTSTLMSPGPLVLGSARAARGAPPGEPEPPQIAQMRRLANRMADSVLRRVEDQAMKLATVPSAKESPEVAAVLGEAASQQSSAIESLETRCRELEAQLERQAAEEARVRQDLMARAKADYEARLGSLEQRLQEVRKSANYDSARDGVPGDEASADMYWQFTEYAGRLESNMQATRKLVKELDGQQREVSLIAAQQRRALPPAEALLAGENDEAMLAEQDRELLDAIQRGEQMCKRMRRHLPAEQAGSF